MPCGTTISRAREWDDQGCGTGRTTLDEKLPKANPTLGNFLRWPIVQGQACERDLRCCPGSAERPEAVAVARLRASAPREDVRECRLQRHHGRCMPEARRAPP